MQPDRDWTGVGWAAAVVAALVVAHALQRQLRHVVLAHHLSPPVVALIRDLGGTGVLCHQLKSGVQVRVAVWHQAT